MNREQSLHPCACSKRSQWVSDSNTVPLSPLAPSLWLYLCYGLHLILIRSDSTRPLTVYCSCSTSVGFSHWQLEDTFHIVLGLWSCASCIAAHSTHSFFFFLCCVVNHGTNTASNTHAHKSSRCSLFLSDSQTYTAYLLLWIFFLESTTVFLLIRLKSTNCKCTFVKRPSIIGGIVVQVPTINLVQT